MATEQDGVSVTHAAQRQRYEIAVDGEPAGFTAYLDDGEQRIFYHTEVPDRFGGRGLAGRVVSHALNDTRTAGLRIVPVCPYVAKWVRTHHDVDDVLDRVTPQALQAVQAAHG